MMFWMAYGSASGGLSASGSSCMARPAGVHDASERQSQGVLFTGLLLFALSRTKKARPARSLGVCHQRWISFLAFKKFFELFSSKISN